LPRLPQLPGRIALKDPDIWINRRLPVDEAANHFPAISFLPACLFLARGQGLLHDVGAHPARLATQN